MRKHRVLRVIGCVVGAIVIILLYEMIGIFTAYKKQPELSEETKQSLFIAMPSRKASDGEYRDIAHPINSSTRENLQKVILESYEKALEEPEEAI